MDIERLKKINHLAKELLEHGIAATMDDAYAQAEKMVEKGAGGILNEDVFHKENEIEVRQIPVPVQARQPEQNLNLMDLKRLGERIEGIEQQIESMFSKTNEIITEINRLHEKIESRTSPAPQAVVRDEAKKEEVQVNLKTEKVEAHPRTGDYRPGDVAIEKMFYFGGAR